MKKIICLAAGLLALNLTPVFAQPTPAPANDDFQKRLRSIVNAANPNANPSPALTKFNLDFPGGTPAQLVAAIEKAMGKPLNVIIASDEKSAKAKIPPVKVSDMDLVRLFKTLQENTKKYDDRHQGSLISQSGFFTLDNEPSENSLWTFSCYEKESVLTQFSLDFPGGTPAQLVKAIEKATGKPLNAIIPSEDADTKLPPLKMDNVDVVKLFTALELASTKQIAYVASKYAGGNPGGIPPNMTMFMAFGFKTTGEPTDNSVWYFHADKPPLPPMNSPQKTYQVYSLAEYLDRGFTVDDITTAIQTGWKISGETAPPDLNYHKETKLLMAYGEPEKLKTIKQVLV